ncbi:g3301 [Coccomyxa viridis]|uniref:G3301 protein n=1 Tax=Coccomyxa viridis TaxID=1274662 RepID=A0ABP1FUD6_9CHLO
MKNGGDPVKAFQEGLLLFNSSSIYINAMAAHHQNTSAVSELLAAIANSEVAKVTNMLGTALANMLPNRVGPDVLRYSYTQAFLPGLITAATGISYEPCLISAGLTGAVVAATGIGIAPRIFNTGPLGAGIIAEAVNIQPALLYIAQSAAPNIAIGASIAPSLINIAPSEFLQAKIGKSISPYGISVGYKTPPTPGHAGAPGGAPAQAPMPVPARPDEVLQAQPAPDAGPPQPGRPPDLPQPQMPQPEGP